MACHNWQEVFGLTKRPEWKVLECRREDQLIHGYRSSARCSVQHAELLQRQSKLVLQMAGTHISRVLSSHLA